MEVLFRKGPRGTLMPLGEESEQQMKSIKEDSVVRAKISRLRNPRFHRKLFALLNYAYGIWSETMPKRMWRGQEVTTTFERFRKEVQILAGHYEPVFSVTGEMRLEAKTISFAGLDEEGFERLYSEVINVLLNKVLNSTTLTEESIRRYVDQVLAFD